MRVDFTAARDAVHLTVDIDEGAPLRIGAVIVAGIEALPDDVRTAVLDLQMKSGEPRDRALVATSRERMVFALRDRGYAHARVRVEERPGATDRTVDHRVHRDARSRRAVRRSPNIRAHRRVNPSVIRRSLTFRPGDVYPREPARRKPATAPRPRALRVRPRQAGRRAGHERPGVEWRSVGGRADHRHRDGGQSAAVSGRHRLRHRGRSARIDRVAAPEPVRRRPATRSDRQVLAAAASARASTSCSRTS